MVGRMQKKNVLHYKGKVGVHTRTYEGVCVKMVCGCYSRAGKVDNDSEEVEVEVEVEEENKRWVSQERIRKKKTKAKAKRGNAKRKSVMRHGSFGREKKRKAGSTRVHIHKYINKLDVEIARTRIAPNQEKNSG